MAEILDGNGIKPIAFYLPQFHAIPENDRAWGKGFTEWTNTKKAKPLFEGHEQPKVPLNDNFYNLLNDDVKIWQSKIAQEHGVFGFCYYHYWFKNGKKLLEKPAEQMLENESVAIPFCFCWANENWSKLWDGGNKELIAEQDYGAESDWKQHFDYLLPFFRDSRYITLDSKPVFIIYKPEEIPCLQAMLAYFQSRAISSGFKGLCFMVQNPNWFFSPSYSLKGFDYQIKFDPFFQLGMNGKSLKKLALFRAAYSVSKTIGFGNQFRSAFVRMKAKRHAGDQNNQQARHDYDEVWKAILQSEARNYLIEGAFVDWDNTARKVNGHMFLGATPDKFEKYMRELCDKVKRSGQVPVVFVNAWNEWCEGAYLEPDEAHGYGYLEALKRAVEGVK